MSKAVLEFLLLFSFAFAMGLLVCYIAVRVLTMRKKASKSLLLSDTKKTFSVTDGNVSLADTVISDEVKTDLPKGKKRTHLVPHR